MLLQSKKPQPRPNRIRNATATDSRPVARVADAEDRRDDERHADGADEDAAARGSPHPAVRQPAADQRAGDRRGLPVERRRHAGLALADVELLLEDRRHPVAHDPARHRRQREVEHQQDERRLPSSSRTAPAGDGRAGVLPAAIAAAHS